MVSPSGPKGDTLCGQLPKGQVGLSTAEPKRFRCGRRFLKNVVWCGFSVFFPGFSVVFWCFCDSVVLFFYELAKKLSTRVFLFGLFNSRRRTKPKQNNKQLLFEVYCLGKERLVFFLVWL